MLRKPRLLLFSTVLLLVSTANATPEDALALFDALCIGTDGEIAVVEKMAVAIGGKQIPAAVMNADPAIARLGGKGFFFDKNGKRYSVAATPNGACSLMAQKTSSADMQGLLLKNYKLVSPSRDESGPQVVTAWKFLSSSGSDKGSIVLNSAKPGFGVDGALSLGYLAKAKK